MRLILISACIIGSVILSGQGEPPKVKTSTSTFSILELTKPKLLTDLKLKKANLGSSGLNIYSPSLKHTAFFCKLEDRLGKQSKFPLKMRLGGIDYVNTLEGKNNFALPSRKD